MVTRVKHHDAQQAIFKVNFYHFFVVTFLGLKFTKIFTGPSIYSRDAYAPDKKALI